MNENYVKMYQLVEFFITKFGYIFVDTSMKNDEEVYLVNSKNNCYQLIRITTKNIDSVVYDKLKINHIKDIISKTLRMDINFVDIHISQDEILENELYDSVAIDVGYYSGIDLTVGYPGIKKVLHEVMDVNEEYKRISDSLQDYFITSKEIAKRKKALHQKPVVTITMISISLILYFLMYYFQYQTNYNYSEVSIIVAFGGYYQAFVRGLHQYYRLLTSGFLHIDFFHLFMNMYALYIVGPGIERKYGSKNMLLTMIASIIMGNVFVYLLQGNTIALGISGGIYGLLGLIVINAFSSGLVNQPEYRRQLFYMLGINMFISLLPDVSLLGHLGGFVSGIIIGLYLDSNPLWKRIKKNALLAFITLSLGSTLLIYNSKDRPVDHVYYKTDLEVFEIYEVLGLSDYADAKNIQIIDFYSK